MSSFGLSEQTFVFYAAQHYANPSCTGLQEFHDDLKKFKYIKRLLKRYKKTQVIGERLILNHIILLHNVFHEALVPMLFFKFEEQYWPQVKTFLVFLNYMPERYRINDRIPESDIPLDHTIISKLRKL
jgi:hypothetical protein